MRWMDGWMDLVKPPSTISSSPFLFSLPLLLILLLFVIHLLLRVWSDISFQAIPLDHYSRYGGKHSYHPGASGHTHAEEERAACQSLLFLARPIVVRPVGTVRYLGSRLPSLKSFEFLFVSRARIVSSTRSSFMRFYMQTLMRSQVRVHHHRRRSSLIGRTWSCTIRNPITFIAKTNCFVNRIS
jgi:hypothetical protein